MDAAALEEKEALAIQKKLAAELEESDIGLEVFKVRGLCCYWQQCVL